MFRYIWIITGEQIPSTDHLSNSEEYILSSFVNHINVVKLLFVFFKLSIVGEESSW